MNEHFWVWTLVKNYLNVKSLPLHFRQLEDFLLYPCGMCKPGCKALLICMQQIIFIYTIFIARQKKKPFSDWFQFLYITAFVWPWKLSLSFFMFYLFIYFKLRKFAPFIVAGQNMIIIGWFSTWFIFSKLVALLKKPFPTDVHVSFNCLGMQWLMMGVGGGGGCWTFKHVCTAAAFPQAANSPEFTSATVHRWNIDGSLGRKLHIVGCLLYLLNSAININMHFFLKSMIPPLSDELVCLKSLSMNVLFS